MKKVTIKLSQSDLGTLIICAVRYCYGRKTYISSLVLKIVKPFISNLSDKDLNVLIKDYDKEYKLNNLDDALIDTPIWIKWGEFLREEQDKRKTIKE